MLLSEALNAASDLNRPVVQVFPWESKENNSHVGFRVQVSMQKVSPLRNSF